MRKLTLFFALILLPLWANAQTMAPQGAFAMRLLSALGLGTAAAPSEAEDRLTKIGIAPKDGWMDDQPMTPAMIDQLEDSLIDAAAENRIPVQKLKAFRDLVGQYDLAGSDEEYYGNESPPPLDNGYTYPGYGYPPMDYGFYPGFFVYSYYGGGWLSDRWYGRGNHLGIGGKIEKGQSMARMADGLASGVPARGPGISAAGESGISTGRRAVTFPDHSIAAGHSREAATGSGSYRFHHLRGIPEGVSPEAVSKTVMERAFSP